MKIIQQNYRTGEIQLVDVPVPLVRPSFILVRTVASLISIGTEGHMLELARKNLIGKALARPDLVRQVVNKVRTEGIFEAYSQVMNRLDTPIPLGYSSAGFVIDVGEGVEGFVIGDRVACAGHPYASHAEMVSMPENLCVKIPDNIGFESAAFVMLGAISLHTVHMAHPTLGERVAVIGLGLLGQIATQLLKAAGCHVFGIDVDPDKVKLAQEYGLEMGGISTKDDLKTMVQSFSDGNGVDAVIIFAGTSSNQPIELAADIARERAKIIVPGLVGLHLPRKAFYEKELQLVVPRSAGPGIYDLKFEIKGYDYPLAYVRWTERRNMQEFLYFLSQGKVQLEKLITHRFPIERAPEAYELINQGQELYIGVLLTYASIADGLRAAPPLPNRVKLKPDTVQMPSRFGLPGQSVISVGLIGAGLFATTTVLPILKHLHHVNLRGIATASGTSGYHKGSKFGFEYCTTDYKEILKDPLIRCVLIATRHDLHARFIIEALQAGKNVFVEKPLALNESELRQIMQAYCEAKVGNDPLLLMVGFNRRFSPFTQKAVELINPKTEPLVITCRINAGSIAKDSWVHDQSEGGGRVIGEVCHFVDLIQCLTSSLPAKVCADSLPGTSDNVVIRLNMVDGSLATIMYVANGDKAFPRERIEVFGQGSVCLIENFRQVVFTRNNKIIRKRAFNIDRGHRAIMEIFFNAIRTGEKTPVPMEEYIASTLTTFKIIESIAKGGNKVDIALAEFMEPFSAMGLGGEV